MRNVANRKIDQAISYGFYSIKNADMDWGGASGNIACEPSKTGKALSRIIVGTKLLSFSPKRFYR
jgi:hypothetical protein